MVPEFLQRSCEPSASYILFFVATKRILMKWIDLVTTLDGLSNSTDHQNVYWSSLCGLSFNDRIRIWRLDGNTYAI
jgi:hypothetical protein